MDEGDTIANDCFFHWNETGEQYFIIGKKQKESAHPH